VTQERDKVTVSAQPQPNKIATTQNRYNSSSKSHTTEKGKYQARVYQQRNQAGKARVGEGKNSESDSKYRLPLPQKLKPLPFSYN
jgi:hypothetical protein